MNNSVCSCWPASIPFQSMWDLLWTKWHCDRFLSQYIRFPLSVSSHHCSILIFIYMLLLPDGQTSEAWEPPKNQFKKNVKVTLVPALRLCTGRTVHRGSRGTALPFHDPGMRRWSASRPGRFYPRERPGTHCTGGWVGPRAGLDRCGKSRPHRDSIPGPSSP